MGSGSCTGNGLLLLKNHIHGVGFVRLQCFCSRLAGSGLRLVHIHIQVHIYIHVQVHLALTFLSRLRRIETQSFLAGFATARLTTARKIQEVLNDGIIRKLNVCLGWDLHKIRVLAHVLLKVIWKVLALWELLRRLGGVLHLHAQQVIMNQLIRRESKAAFSRLQTASATSVRDSDLKRVARRGIRIIF